MNKKINTDEQSYWNKLLESEWNWIIDETLWFSETDSTWDNAVDLCNWICEECIDTFVWINNVRINTILCCPYHPETREVSEHWFCPEIDTNSGLCKVYKTDEYPWQCEWYQCKKDWR